ncbi:MAG: OB-fold domain-containing protein [Pseudomonadota bacterium]
MGPEAQFRAHLAEGRFMIQRSASTGRHVFYPRGAVPGTGEQDLEWVEASGEGVVYSTTVNRRSPEKGGTFNIALIDLAEGPRMMSRVTDIAPEDVAIGMAVTAYVGELNGEICILWRPK